MTTSVMQCEFLKIAGLQIYCEHCLNDKPPIILIHGFVSSTYTFNKLAPLLANHYSVISIDLPGFGRSEKSTSFVYSFEKYAELIDACLGYFRFKEATIVGHSMGGQVALYTAKAVPEKINKLILLGSSGYMPRAKKSLIYSTYLPFFHVFARRFVAKKSVDDYLNNVFYNPMNITDDHRREFSEPLKDRNFYKGLLRLARHREGDLTTNQLKEIKTPTLLLWGTEDKVVPLKVGQKLHQDLPNTSFKSFTEAGHLLSEERPVEVLNEIRSFTEVV